MKNFLIFSMLLSMNAVAADDGIDCDLKVTDGAPDSMSVIFEKKLSLNSFGLRADHDVRETFSRQRIEGEKIPFEVTSSITSGTNRLSVAIEAEGVASVQHTDVTAEGSILKFVKKGNGPEGIDYSILLSCFPSK